MSLDLNIRANFSDPKIWEATDLFLEDVETNLKLNHIQLHRKYAEESELTQNDWRAFMQNEMVKSWIDAENTLMLEASVRNSSNKEGVKLAEVQAMKLRSDLVKEKTKKHDGRIIVVLPECLANKYIDKQKI